MENILTQHRALYTTDQIIKLANLIDYLKNEPLFICDVDPEVDLTSPYFKVEDYPEFGGGKDKFLLGFEKVSSFLFGFISYKTTRLVGDIKWTLRENEFKTITITLYNYQYWEEAKHLVILLRKIYSNCTITLLNE